MAGRAFGPTSTRDFMPRKEPDRAGRAGGSQRALVVVLIGPPLGVDIRSLGMAATSERSGVVGNRSIWRSIIFNDPFGILSTGMTAIEIAFSKTAPQGRILHVELRATVLSSTMVVRGLIVVAVLVVGSAVEEAK
jgi:hypothetical protein